jgi:DNA-binding transcriptional MerR regulator
MDLEQRRIIKFLRIKGLKLGEIAKELSSADDPDAYTPPSIKYWLQQIKLRRTDLPTQHVGGRPSLKDNNIEILSFLRKCPFPSVRTIADSLKIPASRLYCHLVERIGFKNFLVRWVPHTLASELRQKRVELSSQLVRVLENHQRVGFCDIVTGDESWFLRHYDHR